AELKGSAGADDESEPVGEERRSGSRRRRRRTRARSRIDEWKARVRRVLRCARRGDALLALIELESDDERDGQYAGDGHRGEKKARSPHGDILPPRYPASFCGRHLTCIRSSNERAPTGAPQD